MLQYVVKAKAKDVLQLETDRNHLFARRNMPSASIQGKNDIETGMKSDENLNIF